MFLLFSTDICCLPHLLSTFSFLPQSVSQSVSAAVSLHSNENWSDAERDPKPSPLVQTLAPSLLFTLFNLLCSTGRVPFLGHHQSINRHYLYQALNILISALKVAFQAFFGMVLLRLPVLLESASSQTVDYCTSALTHIFRGCH